MKEQFVDGDDASILWRAETADNGYEVGTDTFIARDGEIVAQSVAGTMRPRAEHTPSAWSAARHHAATARGLALLAPPAERGRSADDVAGTVGRIRIDSP